MPVNGDRIEDRLIDLELQPRGQHDGAKHAHRIFEEAHLWIADATDDPRVQIVEAAHVVDD